MCAEWHSGKGGVPVFEIKVQRGIDEPKEALQPLFALTLGEAWIQVFPPPYVKSSSHTWPTGDICRRLSWHLALHSPPRQFRHRQLVSSRDDATSDPADTYCSAPYLTIYSWTVPNSRRLRGSAPGTDVRQRAAGDALAENALSHRPDTHRGWGRSVNTCWVLSKVDRSG